MRTDMLGLMMLGLMVGVLFLAAAARVLYFARVQDGRTFL